MPQPPPAGRVGARGDGLRPIASSSGGSCPSTPSVMGAMHPARDGPRLPAGTRRRWMRLGLDKFAVVTYAHASTHVVGGHVSELASGLYRSRIRARTSLTLV